MPLAAGQPGEGHLVQPVAVQLAQLAGQRLEERDQDDHVAGRVQSFGAAVAGHPPPVQAPDQFMTEPDELGLGVEPRQQLGHAGRGDQQRPAGELLDGGDDLAVLTAEQAGRVGVAEGPRHHFIVLALC
ncbi:hypothetical protein ACTI_55860 [Actinoplanes sp. OR16]|uniref:hypothetical protein n=1 Tax=Actinoplanes sp. OR16 TaxID=946334 RepID=UPI000F6EDA63|nr:hypothetical protein [Actinoplanes sp. OR16]BBH68901.1 hypothetical protein ACTI_55860 [Actinoplanes sp. OR16]